MRLPGRVSPLAVACCIARPPYSVGHVAELHRLPDSPFEANRTAPGDMKGAMLCEPEGAGKLPSLIGLTGCRAEQPVCSRRAVR